MCCLEECIRWPFDAMGCKLNRWLECGLNPTMEKIEEDRQLKEPRFDVDISLHAQRFSQSRLYI